MLAVKHVVEEVNKKAYKNRGCAVMIALDIQNAFNSANWEQMIGALKNMKTKSYLQHITQSYFTNRWIVTKYGKWVQMSCGVPQGSVLGPTMWNSFYDQIFSIKVPLGLDLIAFADDLALVIPIMLI